MNGGAFRRRRRLAWPPYRQPGPLRQGRWAGPQAVLVESPQPQPGIGGYRISAAQPFVADGFNFPRPEDNFFDFIVRVPQLAVSATVTQVVMRLGQGIKGGWIRKIGLGFNTVHGFFQVRVFVLINGGVPTRYQYATIDAANPAAAPFQGSLPTVQIGTIQHPTDTYIELPSNALVEVRFVNNSPDETYSATLRLFGWTFNG